MARKRKKIQAEVWAEWERGQRLLEERIAYHRRKSETERASDDKPQA
jgi:hypothetical protein